MAALVPQSAPKMRQIMKNKKARLKKEKPKIKYSQKYLTFAITVNNSSEEKFVHDIIKLAGWALEGLRGGPWKQEVKGD